MRHSVLLMVLVVAGTFSSCGGGASNAPTTCEWGIGADGSCNPPRLLPSVPDVPPLERREQAVETAPVAGVTVEVTPVGAAAWRLRIANTTDTSISVVWDESSFVASTGETGGRLVRASTRRMDLGRPQPPTPLAPQATITEVVLGEKLVTAEENEATQIEMERKVRPHFIDGREEVAGTYDLLTKIVSAISARREFTARLIVGGKLYLVLQTNAGKHTWSGTFEATTSVAK